jgi:hypothetical protein
VVRPGSPALTPAEIAALIPARVKDRGTWGETIANALAANQLPLDRSSSCAVIAVIAQESGFEANPVVPGLAALAAARIDHFKAKLGPLGDPLIKRLLGGHSPDDARSFQRRLEKVRTERDVDLLFRDLLAYYETNHPVFFATLEWAGKLSDHDLVDLNPITTAGSMQVSVRFAEGWARAHKGSTNTASIRDILYTRNGGVYYGTARLLGEPAHYDSLLFRFADYNAGLYSSRNAAVQAQLARLTGQELALDGDLLSYDKSGVPNDESSASERAFQVFAKRYAPRLSPSDLRRDLLAEKTLAFEDTATYRALEAAAAKRADDASQGLEGRRPAYAILPQVVITSPKLSVTRSTAWYAHSVQRRYETCLGTR